jgi:hypothetical protein
MTERRRSVLWGVLAVGALAASPASLIVADPVHSVWVVAVVVFVLGLLAFRRAASRR